MFIVACYVARLILCNSRASLVGGMSTIVLAFVANKWILAAFTYVECWRNLQNFEQAYVIDLGKHMSVYQTITRHPRQFFLQVPQNPEVVSDPVKAWSMGKLTLLSHPRLCKMMWTGIYLRLCPVTNIIKCSSNFFFWNKHGLSEQLRILVHQCQLFLKRLFFVMFC